MANESIRLGICFSGDAMRFIEAEIWNETPTITNVARASLPKNFDFSIIGDQDYVPQIADLIDKTLENFSGNITSARVCLDRRLALKKNFAVDQGLTDEEIRKHIEWELEQLLVAPRDEYNVDYLHSKLLGAQKDVVVFAAIRKAIVNYLVDIFQKTKFSLEMIDPDMFAAGRTLNAAYSDNLSGANVLVDFCHSGIGVTYFLNGGYALFADLPTVFDGQRFDALSPALLAEKVNDGIEKLNENVEENFKVTEIQSIYVAGTLPHSSIVSELASRRPSADVQVVEPFGTFHKQLNIESQMLIDEQSQEFIACLGMVI